MQINSRKNSTIVLKIADFRRKKTNTLFPAARFCLCQQANRAAGGRVNAIFSIERLPSVFRPCYPENPLDFSGASRLCGSQLARKNRLKQGDLLGFSGHPKRKRHTIKRIRPPNTAFYAEVAEATPHRPTP